MALTDYDYLVRAVMHCNTGLPEDDFVNDFAFKFTTAGPVVASDLDALAEAVNQFYNYVGASGQRVSAYMSRAINRSATHEIQFVKPLTGGSPVYEVPWLGPSAPVVENTSLPNEVCGVLSFHADLTGIAEEVGATRPKARRRGRVYVGPLTLSALTDVNGSPKFNTGFRAALQEAAVYMHDQADLAGFTWSVWSRTDATFYPVVGGWTDDAVDTQRRRGRDSTARSIFTV